MMADDINEAMRALGADRSIPRRDFLQGSLMTAATLLSGPLRQAYADPLQSLAAQDQPGYYPPLLTGMRGSHPGSFESAHALRDGQGVGNSTDTGESYDLIVVGGGISGLSAAHFYRARYGAASRILILDNHDDFGGHAKRNEFPLSGGMQLMNGGTLDIDSPRPYSRVAGGLIRELGIDVSALNHNCLHRKFYTDLGMSEGVFFDRETFGSDYLAVGYGSSPVSRWTAGAPVSQKVREDIARIEEQRIDYLPGVAGAEKKDRLSRMSYRDFLRDLVKADPATLALYQARTHGEWGVGIDAVSALDCWAFGLTGFQGMALPKGSIQRMGYTPSGYLDTGGSAFMHFPDGNATIARLLVRSLVPGVLPGHSVEDVMTAKADYSRLDRATSAVRVRLSSTAVAVQHAGDMSSAKEVRVTYLRGGQAYTARAGHCVLAGYNMMIPYICPELPDAQKAALHTLVKTPLVYTSVAISNWQAFKKLGVSAVYAPGSYHSSVRLNPKVDIGAYKSSSSPEQRILVHMVRTPCQPGLPEHEQNKVGRADLLATSFETFEMKIRDQLARTLGAGGFDPARDIEAITVNRWPHGYAPEHNPLFDPDVPPAQRANIIARARFGRITIANSDSGAAAYTDSAIDQAHRAIEELAQS